MYFETIRTYLGEDVELVLYKLYNITNCRITSGLYYESIINIFMQDPQNNVHLINKTINGK